MTELPIESGPINEVDRLRQEIADLISSGIVEIAARNPNVLEYMRHWEGRAEKAEAALAATDTRIAELEAELKMERERFGQIADRTNEALHISKHEAANWRNLYLKMEAEVERLKAGIAKAMHEEADEFGNATERTVHRILSALVPASPQPADDDWIPWEGGKCPVGDNTIVEIRRRDGVTGIAPADEFNWWHTGQRHNIIAYRVVEP